MPVAVSQLVRASVLVACVAAPAARATSGFPDAIADHLELEAAPGCQLCHADAAGGGTAPKPFAVSMKAHGLVAFDVDSLVSALDQLEDEQVDSDGDGMPDIDELREGTDPNAETTEQPPELRYGAFDCTSAGAAPTCGAALCLLLLLPRRSRRSVLTTARTSANTAGP